MSELKKISEKELLGMTLAELGLKLIYTGERMGHCIIPEDQHNANDNAIVLGVLGIELVPEMPPITIKNLGKFMAKFGEYPKALFYEDIDSIDPQKGRLNSILDDDLKYLNASGRWVDHCDIVDPRWTKENLVDL